LANVNKTAVIIDTAAIIAAYENLKKVTLEKNNRNFTTCKNK
jgi:hypothetical protein